MDARDLLDQIFLDGEVEAARRRRDAPARIGGFKRKAERRQDARDFGIGNLGAQHPRQPRATQQDRLRLRQVLRQHSLGHRAGRTAGDFHDQACRVFNRDTRQFRIHATLEAMRGVGVQAQLAAAADDGVRCEMGSFQEHLAGRVGDAGIEAAHYASQCDRSVGIGNQQKFCIERDVAAVEQCQGLACARAPHADRPGEQVAIERMHRLAELQHHVLGDIHQQADRAHAAATQALGHPQRGGTGGIHAFDHAAEITRRIRTGVELNRHARVMQRRHRRVVEGFDLAAGRGSHVEGNAAHAEAIGAVRRQLQFDAGIRQTEVIRERRAHRRIRWQFEQTGRVGIQAQLVRRAQHAVGGHAAQRGCLDRELADPGADGGERRHQARPRIRRPAHDLQHGAVTGVDLADLQLVGFRMLRAVDDARDDHAVQRVAKHGHRFDFEANGGERRREFVARSRGLDVLAQPVFGEFHANCPRNRTSLSKKLRRSSTP